MKTINERYFEAMMYYAILIELEINVEINQFKFDLLIEGYKQIRQ